MSGAMTSAHVAGGQIGVWATLAAAGEDHALLTHSSNVAVQCSAVQCCAAALVQLGPQALSGWRAVERGV